MDTGWRQKRTRSIHGQIWVLIGMECVLFIQTLRRWESKVKHRLDFELTCLELNSLELTCLELNCLELSCRKTHAKFTGQN
jgi:hypothetical protein